MMTELKHTHQSKEQLEAFGHRLGQLLRGGCVIELVGDVGSGKTTLTKAIAVGLGVKDTVHSPTFTISNRYETATGITLAHYDFYRLSDPGVMAAELAETLGDETIITVIEWAGIVEGILPHDRIAIRIEPDSDTTRQYTIESTGPQSKRIMERI